MRIFSKGEKKVIAQTTIELALFGSVLIFLVGVIIRTIVNTGYSQTSNYRAFRMAMTTSFKYSEGLIPGINQDGNSSRNTSSIIVIEDRLSVAATKYGSVDRVPYIASGSGTHSRNFFYPVDYREYEALSYTDLFINGVHIPLSVQDFRTSNIVDIPGPCSVSPNAAYTKIPNHPALPYDSSCNTCFDLDRDGIVDVTDPALRDEFAWQWQYVPSSTIDVDSGDNTNVDIDCDLREESILTRNGTIVQYIDLQEGDIDTTVADGDPKPQQGILPQELQIFTFARNPAADGLGTGTYLLVEQGRLYSTDGIDRTFIRTAQQKDSLDIVQRVIQLNRNTGHFCTFFGTPTTAADPIWGWEWQSKPNPVEVCSPTRSGCFGSNVTRTCMALEGYPRIYVRSRISDKHGRKWITEIEDDPFVNFNVPSE